MTPVNKWLEKCQQLEHTLTRAIGRNQYSYSVEAAGILDLKVVRCSCLIQPFRNMTVSLLLGVHRNCSYHRKTSDNPETRNTHGDLRDWWSEKHSNGGSFTVELADKMEMAYSRGHFHWGFKRSSLHLCTDFSSAFEAYGKTHPVLSDCGDCRMVSAWSLPSPCKMAAEGPDQIS